MKYRCPTCKKSFTLKKENRKGKLPSYFPFCSQRCKLVDLGQWFDENYKVARRIQSDEFEE